MLIAESEPIVCDDIEDLLASHKLLTGPPESLTAVERTQHVLTRRRTPREVSLTVRLAGPVLDPEWRVDDLDLEEIVLAYLGQHAHGPMELAENVR